MKKNVFIQEIPENVDTNWYFDDDGFFGQDNKNGLVIVGNRQYKSFYYVQDEVEKEVKETIALGDCKTSSIVECLTKATGKQYDYYKITGYCQSDWQYIYYPVDEFSTQCLEEIGDFYFGNVNEFYNDETSIHIPESRAYQPEAIKKCIADDLGLDVNTITLKLFNGYRQVAIYKEV